LLLVLLLLAILVLVMHLHLLVVPHRAVLLHRPEVKQQGVLSS